MAVLHTKNMKNIFVYSVVNPTPITTGFATDVSVTGDSVNKQEITITCGNETSISKFSSISISAGNNRQLFYIYFDVDNANANPFIFDKTAIRVPIKSLATSNDVADAIVNSINVYHKQFFIASNVGNVVTIINQDRGIAETPIDGSSTFDLNTLGLTNLKRINGYVYKKFDGGESMLQKKVDVSLIVNLDSEDIVYGY
jgi:hypothetical protein